MIRSLIYRLFRVRRVRPNPETAKMAAKPPPPKIVETPGKDDSEDLSMDKSIVKRQRDCALAVQKEQKRIRELERQEKLRILNGIIRQLVKRTVNAIDEASQEGKTSIWVLIDTTYSADGSCYGIPDLRSVHMVHFVEKLKHLGYAVKDHDENIGAYGRNYDITTEKVRKRVFPTASRAGPMSKGDEIARWIYYYVSIPMSEY
jgi:hypothetical protein